MPSDEPKYSVEEIAEFIKKSRIERALPPVKGNADLIGKPLPPRRSSTVIPSYIPGKPIRPIKVKRGVKLSDFNDSKAEARKRRLRESLAYLHKSLEGMRDDTKYHDPGRTFQWVVDRLFSTKTNEAIFWQAIADMNFEYREAKVKGHKWHSYFIVMRAHGRMILAAVLHLWDTVIGRILKRLQLKGD